MVYSVFDWNTKDYRYYESPQGTPHGIRPKPVQLINDPQGAGRQLEALLQVVPSGAKLVGRGRTPKGRVAKILGSAGHALGVDTSSSDDVVYIPAASNPLITHPLLALGAWLGILWLATRTAFWLGKSAETAMRK